MDIDNTPFFPKSPGAGKETQRLRGHWVPLDARAAAYLPKGDRTYTKAEAAIAVQVDFLYCRPTTIAGYAAQWLWQRRQVRNFLLEMGVEIIGQTGRSPGQLRPTNQPSSGPATAQLKFFNFAQLGSPAAQQRSSNGSVSGPETAHSYIEDTNNKIPARNPGRLKLVNSSSSAGDDGYALAKQEKERTQKYLQEIYS